MQISNINSTATSGNVLVMKCIAWDTLHLSGVRHKHSSYVSQAVDVKELVHRYHTASRESWEAWWLCCSGMEGCRPGGDVDGVMASSRECTCKVILTQTEVA